MLHPMANEPNWRETVLEPMGAGLQRLFPGYGAPVIPVVQLSGTIGRVSRFRSSGLTISSVAPLLRKAFAIKQAPAVALVINSPGGSPVQAHLIYKRIRALADEKEKTVIVFAEDMCASGGYMIACAGDEIVVDPSSIVGSIGVVAALFGFVDAIHKLGIERRVYTSGEEKVTLDPFQPEKPEDVARIKAIQEEVHDHFIEIVRTRRGEVLARDRDSEIFSGRFWSGKTAVSLGLADRVGDLRTVLRERYGEKVRPRLFSTERSFFGQKKGVGIGDAIGSAFAERLLADLDERALWDRYRLE
jgi:signal peptide peptidase SppA